MRPSRLPPSSRPALSPALRDRALGAALARALAEARRAQDLAQTLAPGASAAQRLVVASALAQSRRALMALSETVGERLGRARRSRTTLVAYAQAASLGFARKR